MEIWQLFFCTFVNGFLKGCPPLLSTVSAKCMSLALISLHPTEGISKGCINQ